MADYTIGQTQVNKRTGERREWTGSEWKILPSTGPATKSIVEQPTTQTYQLPPGLQKFAADAKAHASEDQIEIAAQKAAEMGPNTRGALTALVDAAHGAGLYRVPETVGNVLSRLGVVKRPTQANSYQEGLEKAKEVLSRGRKIAEGPRKYTAGELPQVINAAGLAGGLPMYNTGLGAVTGALSKVPILRSVVKAAEKLPGMFSSPPAPIAGATAGQIAKQLLGHDAARLAGIGARGVAGGLAFPAIEAVGYGEKTSLSNVGMGAAFGAALGPGAFRTEKPAQQFNPVLNMTDDVATSKNAVLEATGFGKPPVVLTAADAYGSATAKPTTVVKPAASSEVVGPPLPPNYVSPEFMGPLFKEKIPPPSGRTGPQALMGERQIGLFPSPQINPIQYGPNRGPVELSRLGTESAKMKRQMQNIDHIKRMLGVQ